MSKPYKIICKQRQGVDYQAIIIIDREDNREIAEYRIDKMSEIPAMRRAINKHLDNGGTLGNYQW